MEDKLKGREEEEGGGRQEIIHLHNTALKKQWDALCQDGLLDPGRSPTQASLVINKISPELGSWILLVCLYSQKSFKCMGFCTSHNQTAAAIRTGATTPDTQFFTPLLTEGELTTGDVRRTINL